MNSDLSAISSAVASLDATIQQYEQSIADRDAQLALLRQPKSSGLARIIPFLNQRTDWIQPANAGDTGGSSDKPSGTFPYMAGDVATFAAQGAYPYNNGYWYIKNRGRFGARFVLLLDVLYPSAADVAASQAVEFELQQSLDGFIYNMAWQCPVRKPGFWRTFDYTNRRWEATEIPSTPFTGGTFVPIAAEFLCDPVAKTVTHVSLTVNGEQFPLSITRPATAQVESNYVSVAFQLDSDGKMPPTPYKVNVRNMHILY